MIQVAYILLIIKKNVSLREDTDLNLKDNWRRLIRNAKRLKMDLDLFYFISVDFLYNLKRHKNVMLIEGWKYENRDNLFYKTRINLLTEIDEHI